MFKAGERRRRRRRQGEKKHYHIFLPVDSFSPLFFSDGEKKDHLVVKLLQAILHGVIAHDATHQRYKEQLFQLSNSITPLSNVLFSSHRLLNWM
jgi:hypothetical protein